MAITLDGTNGVTAPDVEVSSGGSASAPAITVTGDTNTGIFFPAADTIAFAEGGAEAMRIDSSGNVGIGTSSPTFINGGGLHIKNNSNAWLRLDDDGSYFDIASAGTEAYLVNRANGPMFFYTNNTERASIDSSGNLLVGTTTVTSSGFIQTNSSSAKYAWVDRGTSTIGSPAGFFNSSGLVVGQITTSTSTTTYSTSSDYRLKENIAPMTGALDTVAQLKPCTYTWKVDGSSGQGFIAHELQTVVPDCVTGEKDAVDADGNPVYQGVDTSFLVATLTAAIQELKAINDAQASRIETLEAKVAALEANNV